MSRPRCPCGEALHYGSPVMQATVQRIIHRLGPTVVVTVPSQGSFHVPRHYIALHGLKAQELRETAERLGFAVAEA